MIATPFDQEALGAIWYTTVIGSSDIGSADVKSADGQAFAVTVQTTVCNWLFTIETCGKTCSMTIWATGSAPPAVHGFRFDGRCVTAIVTVAFVENVTGAVVVVTGAVVVVMAVEPLTVLAAVAPQAAVTTARSPRSPKRRWVLLSSTEVRR